MAWREKMTLRDRLGGAAAPERHREPAVVLT